MSARADYAKCPPRCIKARETPGFLFCDRCPDRHRLTLKKAEWDAERAKFFRERQAEYKARLRTLNRQERRALNREIAKAERGDFT